MITIWSYLIEPVRCEVCILYWYLWHIVSTQRLASVLNDRRCTFCSWPLGCHCCHSDVSYPVLISWSRWPLCNTVLDIFSVSVINFRVWCDPVSGVSSLLCAHATPDWTLTHHPWLDDSRGPPWSPQKIITVWCQKRDQWKHEVRHLLIISRKCFPHVFWYHSLGCNVKIYFS